METPSKVRSRLAVHSYRGHFFDEPDGVPVSHGCIPSYASIAAIYPRKTDRIAFYSSKKNARTLAYVQNLLYLCTIFVN